MRLAIVLIFSLLIGTSTIGICQVENECVIPLKTLDEKKFNFKIVEEFMVDIEQIGVTKISLFTIHNWTDPGDVLKVEISNNDYDTTFINIEGWVKFDKNYPVSDAIKEKNKIQTDLAFLHSGNGFSYLVLFGWVYASEPGLCTVIDLTSGNLVFNRNLLITDFKDNVMTSTGNKTIKCHGRINNK